MRCFTESLSADGAVTLTAYLHEPSVEMKDMAYRPAVIVFPGGGYRFLSDREAEPIAAAYFAKGYQAYVLRYSVGEDKTFDNALCDAHQAIGTVRRRAEDWDTDPDRIAVCGFSAGGHLAAAAGVLPGEQPNAMILAYPCILEDMSRILAFPVPSLERAVSAETPPAFLFHTRPDATVPVANSLRFADALDRCGVPFELHIFREGGHGLALATALTANGNAAAIRPDAAQWFDLSVDWLGDRFHFGK